MINNVVLVGRLTKDVDLRYTSSGTATGTFTLAVNRPFKNAAGEQEADFVNCVIWRKNAENFATFTHKGSLVGITGRIQTRSYDNNEGKRIFVTEVVADNFTLLEKKSDNQGARNNGQTSQSNTRSNNQPSDPFSSHGEPYSINSDDLPF